MAAEEDLTVYYAESNSCDRRVVWPQHRSKPFYVLFLCIRGRFRVTLRKRCWEAGSGEALIFRGDWIEGELEAVDRLLDYQWCSFHAEEAATLPTLVANTDFDFLQQLHERLIRSYRENGSKASDTIFWMQVILRTLAEDHLPDRSAVAHSRRSLAPGLDRTTGTERPSRTFPLRR